MRLLRLGLSPRVSKHSRCGVSGVAPNAPKPDENPSGKRYGFTLRSLAEVLGLLAY
jgi:hypothetical protein